MKDTNTANCGLGFTTLLAVLFIALKLLGVVTWSWVWVLAPIWIPWGIVLVLLVLLGIVHLVKG